MNPEAKLSKIVAKLQLPFEPAKLQLEDALEGFLCERFGLYYDVGGGKTLVATLIAMMLDLPTVVVMPHILLPQWKRWLIRARVPEGEIYTYYGPKRDRLCLRNKKWVLTSHAIFRQDAQVFRERYKGWKTTLLLDEAQVFKDISTKIHKSVKAFVGEQNPLILMTATPTAKPEDTYAYMRYLNPGVYRDFNHWKRLHVGEVDFFGAVKSYENLDLLKTNFKRNSAKRDKIELFGDNLTPALDVVPYDLSSKHLKLYKRLVNEQLLLLPDGSKIDATTSQRLRHMMQQIVWNPERFSGDEEDKASGFDLLETLCEQVDFIPESRSKFIIWTYYRSTTESIHKWMVNKYGNTGAVAYGGGNSSKAVEAVMFDPKCRWAVFNPLSVGAGLELQHVCWEMFFAELTTSPIPMRQSIGRVDRPGQKHRPTIRFGQAQGTVQKALLENLLRNDERVAYVERTRSSLREELLGS